ncbi:transglutaminase-like domain-containing protein [Enterovibrio coralii]|uniref:transglutaminase-like domain-containing protein n=1 Tax=Enterovibrio coralii TaxID=294935 RepID=UPI000A577AE0|nr:transglutaminase family protein [Enterovibrio coralii]
MYDFVRDDIAFGYNMDDAMSASDVLRDGYGQCNTKGILLMALLRGLGVPCRFHGFTIYNALQKGALPSYVMPIAPRRIIHSWVEVYFEGNWINLEGFIIDTPFLKQVQKAYPNAEAFQGYGIATPCLQSPQNSFDGSHTYIQAEGIADDFGTFDSPDAFFHQYGSNLSGLKKWAYKAFLNRIINRHVNIVREHGILGVRQYLFAYFGTKKDASTQSGSAAQYSK